MAGLSFDKKHPGTRNVAFQPQGPERLSDLAKLLNNQYARAHIDQTWSSVSRDFALADQSMNMRHMERRELSFHEFVKLLGFVCLETKRVAGDIVEIGVWKGKSLAFMSRLADPGTKLIGIDPCALQGQSAELDYFHQAVFPNCTLIKRYSEAAVEDVSRITRAIKLLHIDGGHQSENVWADFLLYERFVVPGGYVVFDDYADVAYSPEVGPAVDRLRNGGFFHGFEIIGQPPGFEHSFVLRRHTRP